MNWFNIGGGPCTLPKLGCGLWIISIIVIVIGLIAGICFAWFIDAISTLI